MKSVLAKLLQNNDRVFRSKFQRRYPALANMVIGRNVANVPSIEEFLKAFHTDHPEVNRWLDTTMRKWLVRDFDKTAPYSPQGSDPDWMQGKTDLVVVKLDDDIRGRIEHVVDYLKAQAAKNPEIKLNNFQAAEAFKQSAEWMEALMKKKIEEEKEGVDYLVLLDNTEGGFRWCKLISENALAREGRLMGHCVGGYWDQVKTGSVEIYSQRDSKNEPHCTIELRKKGREINQIKGKQNKGVNPEYKPSLIQFLNANECDWKRMNNYDLNLNGLMLTGNKQVIDKKNIPDGTTLQGPITSYEGDIAFPDNIRILGNFTASKGQRTWPKASLEVTGNLDITDASKRYGGAELPPRLIVGKDFIASGFHIGALKHLKVGKNAFLDSTELTSLPNNLTVKGELDISNNPIQRLPQKLKVAGELDVMQTNISMLPNDLICGDHIYVDNEAEMVIPDHLKDQVL